MKIMAGDVSIISDAMFYHGKTPVFVEVDVSQPITKNKAKIEKYRRLKEITKQDFVLMWVTELESRRPRLNALCGGLKSRVYTLNEIN